jgi:hypothetical protein
MDGFESWRLFGNGQLPTDASGWKLMLDQCYFHTVGAWKSRGVPQYSFNEHVWWSSGDIQWQFGDDRHEVLI